MPRLPSRMHEASSSIELASAILESTVWTMQYNVSYDCWSKLAGIHVRNTRQGVLCTPRYQHRLCIKKTVVALRSCCTTEPKSGEGSMW